MTAILGMNVGAGTWLQYAVASVESNLLTALPMMICSFSLLYFVCGLLWGKCWNKKWSLGLSPSRWALVAFAAFTASGSLICADSLYGGNFFRVTTAAEMGALPTDEENQDVRTIPAETAPHAKVVLDGLCKMLGVNGDSDEQVILCQSLVDSYFSALILLWGIVVTSTLLLIAGVAFGSIADIKEIKPC